MNPLKDPYSLADNENPYMDCTPMEFKIVKKKDPLSEDPGACTCDVSTSDSSLELEFTPPAGIIHPWKLKKKKGVVHTITQYDPKDFAPKAAKGKKGKKGGKKGSKKGGKKGGKKGKK